MADYLLDAKDSELMLAIVKSLLIYATGVELDILDEKGVNQVFASFQKSGYNLKSLVSAVAQAEKFDPIFNKP